MKVGENMVTGKEKYYFIPDVNTKELIAKKDYIIAVEFDNTDMTEKVRFLNGDAVQAFAVRDTEEELKDAYVKFLVYKDKYWELRAKTDPIEEELRTKYIEMYHAYANPDFGQIIKDRHDPEKMIAAMENKEKEAE